jgi:hypothetical protein
MQHILVFSAFYLYTLLLIYTYFHQDRSGKISVLVKYSKLSSYKYNYKLMIIIRVTSGNSKFKVFWGFTQGLAAPEGLFFCQWHTGVHRWAWHYESSFVVPHTGSPSDLKQIQSVTNGEWEVQKLHVYMMKTLESCCFIQFYHKNGQFYYIHCQNWGNKW